MKVRETERDPCIAWRSPSLTPPHIQPFVTTEPDFSSGVRGMTDSSHAGRSLPFEVARHLETAGYQSVRIAGSTRPFDLIAWNQEKILFLVVRRTRKPGITAYPEVVHRLVTQVSRHAIPAMVQFWVYQSDTWIRYRIMPGGAVPLSGGDL